MYKLAIRNEIIAKHKVKKVALVIMLAFLDQNIVLILCFIYAFLLIMLIRKIAQAWQ